MAYTLEQLSEKNSREWDDFNLRSRDGTFCHSTQWKELLEEEFGIVGRYYLIRDGSTIVGLCPWIDGPRGMLHGLNTLPHSEFSTILLDDSFDTAGIGEVMASLAREYSFVHFDTHDTRMLDSIPYPVHAYGDSGNMILDLTRTNPDALWNSFSKKMKKDIRMFEDHGFETRHVRRGSEIGDFYRYYSENMAYIRGDTVPFSFFRRILDNFPPDLATTLILAKDDLFAGGMLCILHPGRKMLNFEYLALNRNAPNRYTPTYSLFWEGIKWAWDQGIEKVSFGRQKFDPDRPRFRNKAKFGAEFVPIHSRVVLFSRAVSHLFGLKKRLFPCMAS